MVPRAARGWCDAHGCTAHGGDARAGAGPVPLAGHGATLYFRADADGTLRDVFVQRDVPVAAGGTRMQLVLADGARYALSADSSDYTIDLPTARAMRARRGRVPGA